MHPEELKPISNFDIENLNEIINESRFQIYAKDSQIDLSSGGVFFKGFNFFLKPFFVYFFQ